MSQKKDGIPSVSHETQGYLVNHINFENGNVPIYWGPSQDTTESYVNPSGFNTRGLMSIPELVRFVYSDLDFQPSVTCVPCNGNIEPHTPQLHSSGETPLWFGYVLTWTEFVCIDNVLTPITHAEGTVITFEQNPDFDCTDIEDLFGAVDVYEVDCSTVDFNAQDFDALTITYQEEEDARVAELEDNPCM